MVDPIIPFTVYQVVLYAWTALAFIVFLVLLKVTAPYGRHTTAGWGPMISNKVGWMIMEAPVMLVIAFFIFQPFAMISDTVWIIVGLFFFHYINRSFIFPFRIHTKGKKMPLTIVLSSITFNLFNGFLQGYYLAYLADYPTFWIFDIRFILGFILFATGMAINWWSDNILIHLRKPEETHYVIPQKGLFNYVSCPNLFGEIIEWLGFAILCWSLPALSFFIWTLANLVPRALSHHKWYKQKFPDYPAERKAVIPFLL